MLAKKKNAVYHAFLLMRGGAVWQLVGLITRRSWVQILPSLPYLSFFAYIQIHVLCVPTNARWSSLAARRAHNPKVVGSNPTLATIDLCFLPLDRSETTVVDVC